MDDYTTQLNNFTSEFKETPGVVSIEEDRWDGSTFIVYIDFKKYKPNSIPTKYLTYDVDVMDLYEKLYLYNNMIKQCKLFNINKDDHTYQAFLLWRNNILNVINLYESREQDV